jgi:hypothetical protein
MGSRSFYFLILWGSTWPEEAEQDPEHRLIRVQAAAPAASSPMTTGCNDIRRLCQMKSAHRFLPGESLASKIKVT